MPRILSARSLRNAGRRRRRRSGMYARSTMHVQNARGGKPVLSENADMHVESEVLTAFLEKVQQIAADHEQPAEAVARLRPPFAKLLADATWLPDEYQRADPEGGMGQSIGNYL